MYRVAIVSKIGNTFSINAETRQEIDDYLLHIEEVEGLKFYRIIDKETGDIIETQDGIKNKGE
jgi:hypothetical protein